MSVAAFFFQECLFRCRDAVTVNGRILQYKIWVQIHLGAGQNAMAFTPALKLRVKLIKAPP